MTASTVSTFSINVGEVVPLVLLMEMIKESWPGSVRIEIDSWSSGETSKSPSALVKESNVSSVDGMESSCPPSVGPAEGAAEGPTEGPAEGAGVGGGVGAAEGGGVGAFVFLGGGLGALGALGGLVLIGFSIRSRILDGEASLRRAEFMSVKIASNTSCKLMATTLGSNPGGKPRMRKS